MIAFFRTGVKLKKGRKRQSSDNKSPCNLCFSKTSFTKMIVARLVKHFLLISERRIKAYPETLAETAGSVLHFISRTVSQPISSSTGCNTLSSGQLLVWKSTISKGFVHLSVLLLVLSFLQKIVPSAFLSSASFFIFFS